MKIEKWLYFRTEADEDNDNGDTGTSGNNPTSICIPASAIKAIGPGGNTSVTIKFNNLITAEDSALGKRRNQEGNDYITINTTQGKTFEVMEALTRLIHSNSVNDGFFVIADDMTTNFANEVVKPTYFHPDVTSCGDIRAFAQPQGTGIHEYYEEIHCDSVADANEEVVGSLSISLPAQCILLEGALTTLTLSNHADSSVALNYHNAAVADRVAAGGTEWIGAGAASAVSIPNADLSCGSGATQFDTLHSGTHPPVDRAGAVTHFALKTTINSSNATSNAKIGVYVKWWGAPAVSIANA